MDNEYVFNQFVQSFKIEPGQDYIITYKSDLEDPNCMTMSELQYLYGMLNEKYPNNTIWFLPDSLTIKKFDIDDLYYLKETLEKEIKEIKSREE